MTTTTADARAEALADDRYTFEARPTCMRCRRPSTHCYCALIPRLTPKTRVVFVQHPRERDVAIGTARMAHLALDGSVLVEGTRVDDRDVIAALDANDVAVLFPGEAATPIEDVVAGGRPPRTLVVLDGTWSQAKKLLTLNPKLRALPRVSYRPPAPGNYRIRKEPSDECLATIEAVAAVLGILEGDADRYAALLKPFTWMVDRQLEAVAATAADGRGRNAARRRTRSNNGTPSLHELAPVLAERERAVIVYAEANCHTRESRTPGTPEIIHLVARRSFASSSSSSPSSFEAVIKPRRPLGDGVAERLRLDAGALNDGEPVAVALARFNAFLGNDAVLCTWGRYARDLLAQEAQPLRGFVDIRALTARVLRKSAGGIEPGARALGIDVDAAGDMRSMPRACASVTMLNDVLRVLVERAGSAHGANGLGDA